MIFLGGVDYPLHRLNVLSYGANVPHIQTVCEYTFYRGVIEGQQQLLVQVVLPKDAQEVQLLLSLLHQGLDVMSTGEFAGDVGVQKPEGGDSFHMLSVYDEGSVVQPVLPEVHDKFFCFMDIQNQVVC